MHLSEKELDEFFSTSLFYQWMSINRVHSIPSFQFHGYKREENLFA